MEELFDAEATDSILNTYYDLITSDVKTDTKKLFTNAEYESAFLALKGYISDRKTFIMSNEEINTTALTIKSVIHTVNSEEFGNPNADETLQVIASVIGDIGVSAVHLYYATGYVGTFYKSNNDKQ